MEGIIVQCLLYIGLLALMVLGAKIFIKDFIEQLDSLKVLRVTTFLVIASPILTYGMLSISRGLRDNGIVEAIGSADAWIGFAGSIIGGAMTMLALYLTFRHEREVGRQQYIESMKPYISCRIASYDEDARTINIGNCVDEHGYIQCKMKNISSNIANINYYDQYASIEIEQGVYEKRENLDQYGISIYAIKLNEGFFLGPNDDYKWDVNFCVELDNERNYKFESSAFAFRYTMIFEVTDALKANTYFFEFNFDININIDTNGRPVLFLDNQSNTILEDEKLA